MWLRDQSVCVKKGIAYSSEYDSLCNTLKSAEHCPNDTPGNGPDTCCSGPCDDPRDTTDDHSVPHACSDALFQAAFTQQN